MSVDIQVTLVMTIGILSLFIFVKLFEGKNITEAIKDFIKEL
ncbi:MAG: hypothetical protein AB7V16_07105 [Vulcanibacillus sp.]